MPRPLTALDDDVLRQILTRFLPLDEEDYPDALRELTPVELILRDIQEMDDVTPADAGPALILESLEPRHPAE